MDNWSPLRYCCAIIFSAFIPSLLPLIFSSIERNANYSSLVEIHDSDRIQGNYIPLCYGNLVAQKFILVESSYVPGGPESVIIGVERKSNTTKHFLNVTNLSRGPLISSKLEFDIGITLLELQSPLLEDDRYEFAHLPEDYKGDNPIDTLEIYENIAKGNKEGGLVESISTRRLKIVGTQECNEEYPQLKNFPEDSYFCASNTGDVISPLGAVFCIAGDFKTLCGYHIDNPGLVNGTFELFANISSSNGANWVKEIIDAGNNATSIIPDGDDDDTYTTSLYAYIVYAPLALVKVGAILCISLLVVLPLCIYLSKKLYAHVQPHYAEL